MNIKTIILLVIIVILLFNYKKIVAFINHIEKKRAEEFKKRTNLELSQLNRLSHPPTLFLFGLWQYFFQKPTLYFDEENLYYIKKNEPIVIHPISSIKELRKTPVMVNDVKVWKIIIGKPGEQTVYRFRTFLNFNLFMEKVKENPNAVVDGWGIFE